MLTPSNGQPKLTPRQQLYRALDAYCATWREGEQPDAVVPEVVGTRIAPLRPMAFDEFARYGLGLVDHRFLILLAGSRQRLTEVFGWVVEAHGKLERICLPNSVGEEDAVTVANAHRRAQHALPVILSRMSELEAKGQEHVRTCLKQQLPGIIFPVAADWGEFADLLAAASVVHGMLARTGTFRCRHAYTVANLLKQGVMAG